MEKKIWIPKNKRKPSFFYNLSFPYIKRRNKSYCIIKYFKFTDSCIYEFNSGYRGVNKLFGFSIGYHHHNSFRFGWRPTKNLKQIEIIGYEYKNKERVPYINLYKVELNEWYLFKLFYNGIENKVEYSIIDFNKNKFLRIQSEVNIKHKFYWGYKLGLYFGGIYKTIQDIIIFTKKK